MAGDLERASQHAQEVSCEVNISDIAKMAGVSPSAVSRYLHNGYLSEEKKDAVRRAIEETGYRPSVHAQILRTQKTDTVGVIVPKIDSFSVASVVAGIDKVLEQSGFQLLLADTHNSPERELEYLDLLADGRTDGVILMGTIMSTRHLPAMRDLKSPFILVGQHVEGIPSVYHRDRDAFRAITDLLISKGCGRLGFIGAQLLDEAVGSARIQGFQEAVRAAGLEAQAAHVVVADFSISSGTAKARELLEWHGPLDGIVCATDTIAVGALHCLAGMGLRVPEDIMVTGQGGADLCEAIRPTLTTIRYFYEKSGEEAARMIVERVEDPEAHLDDVLLGFEIVEGESTGAG